jgi:hypothetical protein
MWSNLVANNSVGAVHWWYEDPTLWGFGSGSLFFPCCLMEVLRHMHACALAHLRTCACTCTHAFKGVVRGLAILGFSCFLLCCSPTQMRVHRWPRTHLRLVNPLQLSKQPTRRLMSGATCVVQHHVGWSNTLCALKCCHVTVLLCSCMPAWCGVKAAPYSVVVLCVHGCTMLEPLTSE